MRDTFVLTILGPDRTGLVESLAQQIAAVDGNWEASRMTRLAGQFAGLLLVTVAAARRDELLAALRGLDAAGLQVTVRPASSEADPTAGVHLRVDLTGHDRPGLVRKVSGILAELGVNVEDLESEVGSAPMSGEPMFKARIRGLAPAVLDLAELRARLEALAGELIVDLAAE